jgi:hypothetical protein
VNGLSGLTGLAEVSTLLAEESQATPEERSGGPADPRHAERGEESRPYAWEKPALGSGHIPGPKGPENQLLDDEYWFLEPAGMPSDDITYDLTPDTHAAPVQRGILSGPVPGDNPDAIAEQLRQSAANQAINTGASLKLIHPPQALGIQNDDWEGFYETNPGSSDQENIPRQAMSSGFNWGTTDRVQSMARQNEHGFDSKHMMRRYATGSIPGNTMWMRPGGRPLVKSMAGPARPPIGENSPFTGQDLGQNFDVRGALLLNTPTEYVTPPQPNLAPAYASDSGSDALVEWW